jgi:E3 ubiquitin-protein ligase KEG
VIEVGAHPEMKLVRQIGEESSSGGFGGVEMWDATVAGGGGRCKHRVAVKKMTLTEDMDVEWMQGQLESLRRASMWCRNVCTFHGVVKMDGSLCLLMDRCFGSVQSEMQRNEGRLTLEQILRFLFCFSYSFFLPSIWLLL